MPYEFRCTRLQRDRYCCSQRDSSVCNQFFRHSGSNQVGEISYDVKREFWGNIEMVGDSISVSGTMHGLDDRDQIDCDLGFFTIIDAAASEGIEGVKSVAP